MELPNWISWKVSVIILREKFECYSVNVGCKLVRSVAKKVWEQQTKLLTQFNFICKFHVMWFVKHFCAISYWFNFTIGKNKFNGFWWGFLFVYPKIKAFVAIFSLQFCCNSRELSHNYLPYKKKKKITENLFILIVA